MMLADLIGNVTVGVHGLPTLVLCLTNHIPEI